MTRLLSIACALLALAGCRQNAQEPANEGNQVEARAEAGPVKGIDRSRKGNPAPAVEFNDPDNITVNMSGFLGRPVLLNLWATWCAPCVKELPTLDQLAEAHQDGSLDVLAVSQDMGPNASVEAFLNHNDIRTLGAFQDSKMALSGALGVEVLPTTILFDANGKEVWRYVGDLDWTGAEAAKLLAEAGASGGS